MTTPTPDDWLRVHHSDGLADWLAHHNVGLAFTTYQSGKLFLLGRSPTGRLAVFERTFTRAMGLWADGQTLWLATLYQLWRFENVLDPGATHDGHDRLYVPRIGFTTGELDVHDVAVLDHDPLFVNTRCNCLARLHTRHSFAPTWLPPFITQLTPEDRCHLNGLAVDATGPRYVTAAAATDSADGWRPHKRDGGVVIDVRSNDIVLTGQSMPHSPRLYQNHLWLHNSGAGYFGRADLPSGKFEPIAFAPGYLRGLAFVGNYAIVGLSQPRHERTFADLPLEQELTSRQAEPRCGLAVIDLGSGAIVHTLTLEGVVRELYDVVVLPGVVKPMAFGFKSDEIQRFLSISGSSSLSLRSSSE